MRLLAGLALSVAVALPVIAQSPWREIATNQKGDRIYIDTKKIEVDRDNYLVGFLVWTAYKKTEKFVDRNQVYVVYGSKSLYIADCETRELKLSAALLLNKKGNPITKKDYPDLLAVPLNKGSINERLHNLACMAFK